ncbi:hypothetical protein DEU56DRAFT_918083 [Suillus clintonianus]|uniref:uncharacterized protein n=1 Tax=Suillus clintonianus TaxID=1904413 RepID=UPI001B883AD5|nr:uncharacterized protein DEU56DRAFT_918083 [Suillus clintonianus]KAG2121737.1 hypothetical protein DEU56DRAFT_918083 [Suillus clintonianus]
MDSVSEARARQRIKALTRCQGVMNGLGQRGSSSTKDQNTHELHQWVGDHQWVGSAMLVLDIGSRHSRPVKGSQMGWVSKARARQRIKTLTRCQGITNGLGQRGSSSTEDQDTHSLIKGSPMGWGSQMGWVSEARARQRIKTLTNCQGITNGLSQQGSSSTEDQDTHSLVKGSPMGWESQMGGQRGSSSTEDQDTHELSRDHQWVGSARLELDIGSGHSHPVKGSQMGWGSQMGSQRSSSSTEDQDTHSLVKGSPMGWITNGGGSPMGWINDTLCHHTSRDGQQTYCL